MIQGLGFSYQRNSRIRVRIRVIIGMRIRVSYPDDSRIRVQRISVSYKDDSSKNRKPVEGIDLT